MAPEGTLTPAQFEIMNVVWNHARQGATVAEIWREISESREVSRTTILNLVDRLEKRGWLKRREGQGVNRFVGTLSRDKTASLLTGDFVDDFFGGSASELVMSLLGSKRLKPDEIQQLERLIEDYTSQAKSPEQNERKAPRNDR
ncbi:Penicillinase repressor [Gimesia alba]|uniref:Penicillinase repressor n=1 Tax=Gimesia alba TaxID=2527973 RepID=A0A517RNT8_9PLAN|nr:BlaI/MecI/CopY family transcriptional regulator [Gimesia alba]QDT45548.1 Penicillinase repressor [Gimesia alba]